MNIQQAQHYQSLLASVIEASLAFQGGDISYLEYSSIMDSLSAEMRELGREIKAESRMEYGYAAQEAYKDLQKMGRWH